MYENYTHQALPSKEYRELLGTALYVFNSNNSLIIENILNVDRGSKYTWYDLIDKTSGQLIKKPIEQTIEKTPNGEEIVTRFHALKPQRDRIIHGFPITDKDGEQRLATKDQENVQFVITEEYLKNFIVLNDELSALLHDFRTATSKTSERCFL